MRHLRFVFVAATLACGDARRDVREGDDAMRPLGIVRPTSPIALRADSALREGRAWEASRILETALRDSAQRTPELILLAAAAAAAWEGWEHAAGLLDGEVWVDSLFGGAGRALLARSALEMDRDTVALAHAQRAVASGGPEERGSRLILLARALHRLERRDSARATYERAAEELPSVADWLRLRAAGLARAERDRAATYATLRLPAAVVRAPTVEAQARERYGDLSAAARAYEAVGDRTSALRSRVLAASARGRRTQLAALRREMYASVRNQPGTPAASASRTVLDAYFTQRSVAEELLLAHAAYTEGDMSRAAAGFGRAARAGRGRGVADRDRFVYGRALLALGREREAAVQFARVRTPRSLAGQSAYERARALLRLDRDREARALLRRVVSQYGTTSPATPSALYLLADLATDERRDGPARAAFREIALRFPTAPEASTASFRAALIAFVTGDVRTAAREFDSLAAGSISGDERASVVYWSGRAWQRSGDTAAARARWQSVLANAPQSYYALVAARRLGVPSWAPARAPGSGARAGDSARPVAGAASPNATARAAVRIVMTRARLLESLGMDAEARLEYDRLAVDAEGSMARMLATGEAFVERGLASRAIRLGHRAVATGAGDERAYRLIYPVTRVPLIAGSARSHKLDPAMVAALIRQESYFDPRATSRVGARGLMQVMPRVGRELANTRAFPFWDDALLYQPDVNIVLGTAHLARLMGRYDETAHALAAYNAGESRVARWRRKRGAGDLDVFVERIPFDETRDYVRILERNAAMYRVLYEWDAAAAAATTATSTH